MIPTWPLDRLRDLPDNRYSIIGDISLKNRLAPSGGAGYLLSRSLVEQIVAVPNIPATGAEDLIYGKIALELGAIPLATERLCMHSNIYPVPENDVITSHWCKPEQITAIDLFYQNEPDLICLGEHPHWTDHLYFYKQGYFRRTTTGCCGKWRVDDNNALCMEWFSWAKEQLIFMGNQYVGSELTLTPPAPRSVPNALVEVQKGLLEKLPPEPALFLHLGCGSNHLNGWFNLDMPNFDITHPLPFANESAEALFLEHVIEHVSPPEAYNFFQEARRILKPGGILRLAFPDLLRIAHNATPEYANYIHKSGWSDGTPGSEIRSIIVNNNHKAVWTAETLMIALHSAGFSVKQFPPGESDHPHMRQLEHHGDQIGDLINRIETSCVEAVKPL